MPKTKSSNPFLKMTHLDLAYAVQRLVRLGTTTADHVRSLAHERKSAIELLEARVAALRAAIDIDAPTAARRKYEARATKQGRVEKRALAARHPVGRPKGSKNEAEAVKVAKAAKPAKRAGKVSTAVKAARQVQGRYMGIRRQLSARLQAQATKLAQAKGVAAALKFVEAKYAKPAKQKAKMSPKMLAARKLQGRYLGLRRQLSGELQTRATQVAQADGVAAALKFVEAHQPTAEASQPD